LKDSNPGQFGRIVGSLSQKVSGAAATADPKDKAQLQQLAGQLHDASKSGDVAGIKPPAHHHHHRVHVPATKQPTGGTGTLLSDLLQQLDLVFGPNATPETS
jgi:phosphatidylethanolamine-binding protein (PEBP) family uncharacterized protein